MASRQGAPYLESRPRGLVYWKSSWDHRRRLLGLLGRLVGMGEGGLWSWSFRPQAQVSLLPVSSTRRGDSLLALPVFPGGRRYILRQQFVNRRRILGSKDHVEARLPENGTLAGT